ncbi:MAG: glycosyltransferase [Terriglobales bacterium]
MNDLRRLAWVIDQLGPGGAERLALRFAAIARSWHIELVCLHAATQESLERLWGRQLEPLRGRIHCVGMHGLDDAAGWCRLLRLLARSRPELIHTHLRYATIWGALAAQLLRRPFVSTVHSCPPVDTAPRQRLAAAWERRCRRQAARVVYVSAAQRQAWGAVAARERAVVIGNGVCLPEEPTADRRALRQALGLPGEARIFITVAVVRAPKGWRTWLAAAEQIAVARPQAHFVWVGGGPEWPLLRQAADRSPLAARIALPGSSTDVARWLQASDLFLFPSEQEAQPTAVMEAMAAGLPVVASRLPAIEEVLAGCGQLVAVGDARALATAALAWSESRGPGASAARAAAAAGRQRTLGPLSEACWLQRLSGLYEEVLEA